MWHQWTIVAETATRAQFGGACDYAAAAPRPPPHNASVDSATLVAGSMAHKIQYMVFIFRAINDLAPEYTTDMITEYTPGRQLRSAGSRVLRVPRHNLDRYVRRGFSVTAPRLWNDLPESLRLIDSLERFKSNLNKSS